MPQHATWGELLREAVEKPGRMLEAYTAFHNFHDYSFLFVDARTNSLHFSRLTGTRLALSITAASPSSTDTSTLQGSQGFSAHILRFFSPLLG